jgi:hypothetical protein
MILVRPEVLPTDVRSFDNRSEDIGQGTSWGMTGGSDSMTEDLVLLVSTISLQSLEKVLIY